MNENKIKNYGLVVPEICANLDSTHYLAGANSKLGVDILQADGNWRPFVPKYEPQFNNNYETYGCTVFGTLNALEVLMKKIHGGDYDYAERFIYILAGIRSPGGDPHKVAELIRTKGLVKQELLPMTDTYEQFLKPDPMTKELLDEAHKFLDDKEIGHEWIFTNNPNTKDRIQMLKFALQRGTVAMAVTAWYQDADGLYIDNGQGNTHWVCLVDIEEKDGKFYPIVIDSYDLIMNGVSTAFFKKLHPDHHVEFAKRYSITPKKPDLTPAQRNYFLEAIRKILVAIGILQERVNELKKVEAVVTPPAPPVVATTPFPEPTPTPKYLWDTKTNIRHSVRVICDEEKLSVKDKNDLCATVEGESGFDLRITNPNYVTKNGKTVLASTDYGLCQINDFYHIGSGKSFPSIDYVLDNPEKVVRWMCRQWKIGNKDWWIAYKNGRYLQFL